MGPLPHPRHNPAYHPIGHNERLQTGVVSNGVVGAGHTGRRPALRSELAKRGSSANAGSTVLPENR